MQMPVVDVRVMSVGMSQFRVAVGMTVRFSGRVRRSVLVLVMFVVDVAVFVLHRLVLVFVFVPLREVQPDADAHQRGRHSEENGESVLKNDEGKCGPDEGGEREIGARPSRP